MLSAEFLPLVKMVRFRRFFCISFLTALSPAFLLICFLLVYPAARVSRLDSDQVPKNPFGLVQVDGFGSSIKENGVDIIFVHGLASNPDTTWSSKLTSDREESQSSCGDTISWIQDFIPNDILPHLRDEVRVFFFNHDTHFWRSAAQSRLETIGSSMLGQLQSELRRSDEEWNRKFIFVGHSFGGLIIKEALVQASKSEKFLNIAQNSKGFIFLGTPHRGSKSNRLGYFFAWLMWFMGSNSEILTAMDYDSEGLRTLQTQWLKVTSKRRVVNFYEERKISNFGSLQIFPYFVVEPQSATYDGVSDKAVENIPLAVDHFGLKRFSKRDQNYKIIKDKLNELLSSPGAIQEAQIASFPQKPISNYVERSALSMEIERKLRIRHEGSSVPYAVAVHGLGGTGKSELAMRYIMVHMHEFDTIFWIEAQDDASTKRSFKKFADELKLQPDQRQIQALQGFNTGTIEHILRWFKKRIDPNQKWLVVVDNADDVRWGIQGFIPQGPQGTVLITSQDLKSKRLIDGACENVEVGIMEKSEAEMLILNNLGLHHGSISDDMQQSFESLIHRLGSLPIALDLASISLQDAKDKEKALRDYIRNFDEFQYELLHDKRAELSFSDKTIWTVWNTSFRIIDGYSASGVKPSFFLAFLAHFKGSIIQDSLFRQASLEQHQRPTDLWQNEFSTLPLTSIFTVRDGEWKSFYYEQAIEILAHYHLVKTVDEEQLGITMHSLVKWRGRMHMPEYPWPFWNSLLLFNAMRNSRIEDIRDFNQWYIRDHLRIIHDLLENYSLDWREALHIAMITGEIFLQLGEYKDAEILLSAACELLVNVSQRIGGLSELEDIQTAIRAFNLLAIIFRRLNYLKDAEDAASTALAIHDEHNVPDDRMRAGLLNNLLLIREMQGEHELVQDLYRKIQNMDPHVLKTSDAEMVVLSSNMARSLLYQGKLGEAKDLAIETLIKARALWRDEHLETLKIIHIIASCDLREGRYLEAEQSLVSSLQLAKKIADPRHPLSVDLMKSLVFLYEELRRYEEAEPLCTLIVETLRDIAGPDNTETLDWIEHLAYIMLHLNQPQEASRLLAPALEASKLVHGKESPETMGLMILQSVALMEKGQENVPEELLNLTPEAWEAVWRWEQTNPVTVMASVSREHLQKSRFHKAQKLSAYAFQMSTIVYESKSRKTLRSMEIQVWALISQRKWDLAQSLGNEALKASEIVRGLKDPITISLMNNMKAVYETRNALPLGVCGEIRTFNFLIDSLGLPTKKGKIPR